MLNDFLFHHFLAPEIPQNQGFPQISPSPKIDCELICEISVKLSKISQ